jgi:tetratricopeptide (TPR) repeat protein
LMLQLPDARPEQARPVLERALAELQSVGRPADIAETEAELARCDLLAGDVGGAAALAATAVERASDGPILEHAKARLVLAEVLLAEGRADEAVQTFRAAALALDRVKASRDAAAAWRRLGSLLMQLGRYTEAGEAYERLADARGVPKPASTSRPVTG